MGCQEQREGQARHHCAPAAADEEGRRSAGAIRTRLDGPRLGDADLYFDHLADLKDLANEVAPKNGGWLSPNDYLVRGKWTLLPWWQPPFPMAIRTDLLEQIGEKNPDTWEDWLRIGKKGKAIGHPFGTALGHSADANTTMLSILWSYGGSY